MQATMRITPAMFRAPLRLMKLDGLRVELFRYDSGVEGIRVTNDIGKVEILPFQGQQIWDAQFYGRTLTMRSTFSEPVRTKEYLANYGAYFIHCGGSAMGNPAPGDSHALHGELPNARMDRCDIAVASDGCAPAVIVSGTFTHRVAFGPYFRARMRTRITQGTGVMVTSARLTNLSSEHRPLMYLAHVNFRPAEDGAVLETLQTGAQPVSRADAEIVRNNAATTLRAGESEVGISQLLQKGVSVTPELVQTVPIAVNEDGWRVTVQQHRDHQRDIVASRSTHLNHTIRWLRRTADDDAFGLALPSSAEVDGFIAERAKGHVALFGRGRSLSGTVVHGALGTDEDWRRIVPMTALTSEQARRED